jgi:hypothetical protein
VDIWKILLTLIAIGAVITLLIATAVAYGKRRDQGFAGGASILTGWWLLFPYDDDGVTERERGVVRTARISWLVAASAMAGLWLINR